MTYVIYAIISGVIFMMSIDSTFEIMNYNAKKMGYTQKIKDTKNNIPKNIINNIISLLIHSAIAPITNIATIILIFGAIHTFKSKENLKSAIANSDNFIKIDDINLKLNSQKKFYNKKDINDAMILDGADEKTIKVEDKKIKKKCSEEVNFVTDSNVKILNAMYEAKQFLDEIKLNAELSEKEYNKLYDNYVKDFSSNKPKGKAIEKTFKLVNKREN